jgi:hypothetical protein
MPSSSVQLSVESSPIVSGALTGSIIASQHSQTNV